MKVNLHEAPPAPKPPPTFSVGMTLDELHDLTALLGRCAGLGQVYAWYTTLLAALKEAGVEYDPNRVRVTGAAKPIIPVVRFKSDGR